MHLFNQRDYIAKEGRIAITLPSDMTLVTSTWPVAKSRIPVRRIYRAFLPTVLRHHRTPWWLQSLEK